MGKRTGGLTLGLGVTLSLVWFGTRFFSDASLPGGHYALWRAAKEGRPLAIRRPSFRQVGVNRPSGSGWTPLLAAAMGHTELVRTLIPKGADVNARDA